MLTQYLSAHVPLLAVLVVWVEVVVVRGVRVEQCAVPSADSKEAMKLTQRQAETPADPVLV